MIRPQSICPWLLLLMPGVVLCSQDPLALIRAWLPMTTGDRWTYEEEVLGGDRTNPEADRWQQTDTTVTIQTISQGMLIRRKVEFLNNTAPPNWKQRGSDRESNILARNNCIYYLDDSQSHAPGYGWDSSRGELTVDFLKDLASGAVLPDVCLPLQNGKSWGDPNKGRDLWTVTGLGRKNRDDPASAGPRAWRIQAQLSSGDDNYIWFEQGIGLTAARIYHNGTYDDQRIRLLRFEAGTGKAERAGGKTGSLHEKRGN